MVGLEGSPLPLVPQERKPEGRLPGSLGVNAAHTHHGWLGKPSLTPTTRHPKGTRAPCACLGGGKALRPSRRREDLQQAPAGE